MAAVAVGFAYEPARPAMWAGGFGISGALCVTNALRSGRFHCAFTGPIFLIGSALAAARKCGLSLSLGWMAIGAGVMSAVIVALVVEGVTGSAQHRAMLLSQGAEPCP